MRKEIHLFGVLLGIYAGALFEEPRDIFIPQESDAIEYEAAAELYIPKDSEAIEYDGAASDNYIL